MPIKVSFLDALNFRVLNPNYEHTRIAWELNLAGFRVLPPRTEDFVITGALVRKKQELLIHCDLSGFSP